MAKGYIHRVYQFVSENHAGFEPPVPWTRFQIGPDVPIANPADPMPESLTGSAHPISKWLFDEWRRTLDMDVERALERVVHAKGAARDPREVAQYERQLEIARLRAWAPDRRMLIRAHALRQPESVTSHEESACAS